MSWLHETGEHFSGDGEKADILQASPAILDEAICIFIKDTYSVFPVSDLNWNELKL